MADLGDFRRYYVYRRFRHHHNDGDGIIEAETLNGHLGPNAPDQSVADSPAINSKTLVDMRFHTSDPIPQ